MFSPLASSTSLKKVTARPYVIGICGGPGSGRSSVANSIKDKIPHAIILNSIHFYKPKRTNLRSPTRSESDSNAEDEKLKSEIKEVYKKSDFDSPAAIDWSLMIRGIEKLKNGCAFEKPIYDDTLMVRLEETEHLEPSSVVIIEGHLIFCN